MIIQSKFKDYYDSLISSANRDPKIVYHRETKEIQGHEELHALAPKEAWKAIFEFTREGTRVLGSGEQYAVDIILFCGKVYPVYRQESGWSSNEPTLLDYENPYAKLRQKQGQSFEFEWNSNRHILAGTTHPAAEILNKTLAPVILINAGSYYRNKVTLNPRLQNLHFPVNIHETLQTLMSFLAPKEPVLVEVAAKYKAQAHGMDKSSFRRDPGGPTRKRKRLAHT